MLLRGITEEMIQKALVNPDKVGVGYDVRDLVFKKFPRGIIKIVFIKKKTSYIIISAIWHTKI
ncbi:MAG: hypothetical protein UT65_C0032G0009 [Parcubacteria group bacterium GW2011_GWF2_39_8b]|nr:MAG: hypothetical protein UT65_C0032G0009 [Parcubacteria group bacterium GW2011_GWF2_39_8b]KKR45923.1 MAG: hypothetical protein UT81_C0004G0021 [Parcubacteria group bacterium GW2011_GWA2_40_14]OHA97095.1 MAG: hypothetical protein A3C63_00905 [Candidatus Zambryskibacteria bacterium RIFCSPHIGHO2_02_FULL_39_82]OHB13110.1 MAG: hypothetical protein A2Y49_02540 [Candidatus Zambryskibacteria bacterium RIFCSPLOWO2_12_39_8]